MRTGGRWDTWFSSLCPRLETRHSGNMNYCKTSQEAYLEALRVERMLRRSRMQQCQRRANVVERLFPGEDNPTLVIRWLLNTNEKEEEEWRHAKKFYTRVTVEDKSAELIIDNGSAINFVAQEVIDKLHWQTKKLSKPYQVTWSNGHVIPMTHRFWYHLGPVWQFTFKIKWIEVKYKEGIKYKWIMMVFYF